jgi:tryptophanyl-tRNA synthetase
MVTRPILPTKSAISRGPRELADNSWTVRIFSGIQPTGQKTFGNYSGGFRQYAATQEQGEAFFCVVDLHSITVEYDPAELRESTLDLAAMLFATGIDPKRSTVFVQSHNPAHPEAAWLLGAVTAFGDLRRMTQFKDKSDAHEFVSSGLFTYPVLMAADILLYHTDVVPIGDDQRQHMELTRDIAQRFNQRFGETFTVPRGQYPDAGARIMDLTEPEKKMSTSTSPEMGKLLMVDPPDLIRKKIMSAVTDTGREVRRGRDKPGVTNLIDIMSVATGRSAEDIEREYEGQGYGRFKADVAEAVIACLTPIKQRYTELRQDQRQLEMLLAEGVRKAIEVSMPTLQTMYDRMGFTRRNLD